ncbi:MATE family efflux transporter [Actinomyces marmotae]|uniref:MATE family efflux transporter n=1 Tax=Actinomyces marmotae TaxID=2737173 RepID=UPI001356AE1F
MTRPARDDGPLDSSDRDRGRPAGSLSPASPASRRRLDRSILGLALPALGALVAEPLLVLVDSAMVGHLGATSLAGLSLASTVLTTLVGLFVFLAYATTATTARLFGAGDRAGGLRAGIDGLWLALLLGAGTAILLGAGGPWLVEALGARGTVADAATAYLRASAPGLPGMLAVLASTGTLRGLLDTRTPFIVATTGAALNAGLNAVLLYGVGMGIAGSGLGTALAQTAMALALARPIVRAARAAGVPLRPHRAGLGTSLGAGLPLLVRTVSLRAAILLTVWAATALGEAPLAAHQVVNSLWAFAAFALDALAVAAQALIGTALGQADAADSAGEASAPPGAGDAPPLAAGAVVRRTVAWGALTGAILGAAMAAASPWLPRLFTSDAGVVGLATPVLLVTASAMPLAGVVYLLDGVLMGAGEGRYLARAGALTLLAYAPLAVAVGHLGAVSRLGDHGLALLWLAFAWVFMGARAATTAPRARAWLT